MKIIKKDGQNAQQRHKSKMQRKKEVVDAAINRADQHKGILLVLTGNGKGKSSSAFGMVARALGHGMRVAVAQFIKGRADTGEEAFFRLHKNCQWHVLGEGFTWETQHLARDTETAERGWQVVQGLLKNEMINLVVIDELTYPLKYGWLDTDLVLADIKNRPDHQHVVITGRNASQKLCDLADTVSEIADKKHAFRAGIGAQKGVDL